MTLNVPHIQQSQESSCGAAALSMVYKYLGLNDQNEDIIWDRLKEPRPSRRGEYFLRTVPMAKDSQNYGLSYFMGKAVLDAQLSLLQPLKEFLSLSIPIIVCQRISSENTLGHFRVVIGVEKNNIYINDPLLSKGKTTKNIDEFLSLWKNANNEEVVGGEFLAVFKKEQVKSDSKFLVSDF